MEPLMRRLLTLLDRHGAPTVEQVASHLGIEEVEAQQLLQRADARRLVLPVQPGVPQQDATFTWHLTDEGRAALRGDEEPGAL